jgi:hypothetical protein
VRDRSSLRGQQQQQQNARRIRPSESLFHGCLSRGHVSPHSSCRTLGNVECNAWKGSDAPSLLHCHRGDRRPFCVWERGSEGDGRPDHETRRRCILLPFFFFDRVHILLPFLAYLKRGDGDGCRQDRMTELIGCTVLLPPF